MGDGELTSESDFDIWCLCWTINLAFVVKCSKSTKCLKCSVSLENDCGSSLVSEAVRSDCGHTFQGFLCLSCDEETVLRLIRFEEKCFVDGCPSILEVRYEAILRRLPWDPELVSRYIRSLSGLKHVSAVDILAQVPRGP